MKTYIDVLKKYDLPIQFFIDENIYCRMSYFGNISKISIDDHDEIEIRVHNDCNLYNMDDQIKFRDHHVNLLSFKKYIKYVDKMINLKKSHVYENKNELFYSIKLKIRLAKVLSLDEIELTYTKLNKSLFSEIDDVLSDIEDIRYKIKLCEKSCITDNDFDLTYTNKFKIKINLKEEEEEYDYDEYIVLG